MSAATVPGLKSLAVGGRKVALSNLGKPLYPSGFTKVQVLDYYLRVAPAILPHLKGRAVTLKRFPDGSAGPSFFEKNCPAHRPPWVRTAPPMAGSGRRGRTSAPASAGAATGDAPGGAAGNRHCLLNDAASLLWAANLAALELHVPLARAAAPDRPTTMVYDLDPGHPATLADCVELALKLKDLLDRLGLACYPKTSGGKGLHVYVPLNTPAVTFERTKTFSRAVALLFERQHPGRVTATMSKSLRPGKVFVDWSQNDRHKTTACAYTLRATETPRVSTPLAWEELESVRRSGKAEKLLFTPEQVVRRVGEHGDLFLPVLRDKQRLPDVG